MRKYLLLAIVGILVYLGYSYTQGDSSLQTHTHTSIHTITERAPRTAQRINQLDPGQYYPAFQDYSLWSPSTCSSAAMTEVINSYGHDYKLGDILKVEAGLGEIKPDVGLVEPQGIAKTVTHFGFSARYLPQTILQEEMQQVETIANGGHPVIVSFPPETYVGGHIFVVDGSTTLYYAAKKRMETHLVLTDSARPNWRFMPEENFLKYWRGFAVEVYPKGTRP